MIYVEKKLCWKINVSQHNFRLAQKFEHNSHAASQNSPAALC